MNNKNNFRMSTQYTFYKKPAYIINLSTLALYGIVCISFLRNILSGYIFSALLLLFIVMLVFPKKKKYCNTGKFFWVWMICSLVVIVGFFRSPKNDTLMDVIVFLCGALLICFCSENEDKYIKTILLIKTLGAFFAFGVLLETFFPFLYHIILKIFPQRFEATILEGGGELKGFTINVGYSAGYINAGIIAIISSIKFQKRNLDSIFLFLFLLVATLFTGKRGPTIFLLLANIICSVLPANGMKKIKKYIFFILSTAVIMAFFFVFSNFFERIPVISRIIEMIEGLMSKIDVSSSRLSLYIWALKLFAKHPIFGIGWGRFRTTVIGNVTVSTALDTHNIYLQLLCETGIIGLLIFLVIFILFWNTTKNAYSRCVNRKEEQMSSWRQPLFFSFAYQTYFLLYGLTGNPLYDQHFQIIYIFSCCIIAAYSYARKHKYNLVD